MSRRPRVKICCIGGVAEAEAAVRHGATIRTGVHVEALQVEGGRVTGVVTSDGVIPAGTVVVTAGIYTPHLLYPLGLELPMMVTLCPVVQTEPVEPMMGPVLGIASGEFAGRQEASGRFRFTGLSDAWTEDFRAAVVDLLGALAYGELMAFSQLAADAESAPSPRDKAEVARLAVTEFLHYEQIVARLEELGELGTFGGVRGAQRGTDLALDPHAHPFDDGAALGGEVDQYPAPVDGVGAALDGHVGRHGPAACRPVDRRSVDRGDRGQRVRTDATADRYLCLGPGRQFRRQRHDAA